MPKSTQPNLWDKNYPVDVNWYEPITSKPIYSLLDEAAEKFKDNNAIDFLGTKYTYKELSEQVNKAAKGFQDMGVKKGDPPT